VLAKGDGFAKKQDATNTKKVCWWIAPKMFFVYSELKTTNPPI
jgi:hypothetical protein